MSANYVSGRLHDGIVEYPWEWEELSYDENGNALRDENNNLIGSPRMLGTEGDGKWNCHNQSPEQCCQMIKDSAPIMDTKGNYIQCHIFVPESPRLYCFVLCYGVFNMKTRTFEYFICA